MSTTITITLADDSHTAVEHAINHARAIEREFERVGCPALFEVHKGSLADESVSAERERILNILKRHYLAREALSLANPEDRYWAGCTSILAKLINTI